MTKTEEAELIVRADKIIAKENRALRRTWWTLGFIALLLFTGLLCVLKVFVPRDIANPIADGIGIAPIVILGLWYLRSKFKQIDDIEKRVSDLEGKRRNEDA